MGQSIGLPCACKPRRSAAGPEHHSWCSSQNQLSDLAPPEAQGMWGAWGTWVFWLVFDVFFLFCWFFVGFLDVGMLLLSCLWFFPFLLRLPRL